jgi:F-type H+-transporting ATPase subunit b
VAFALILPEWLDYPGFEVWRFVNLFLFIAGALYLHHRFGKPISEALRSRRANIKLELESARQRRDSAAAELKEVEARLALVDNEVAKIRSEAEAEAETERHRIKASTEMELARLKAQADRDIANVVKNAQMELRYFVASQGVKAAETLIRRDLNVERDARLIDVSADQFGGVRH